MRRKLDRLDLKVSEVRHRLAAIADDDELDLGEDEAVSTAVLSHVAMQVCEAAEVLDLSVVAFNAHPGVPAIERLHESDDATESSAVDELRGVVCVVGDEAGVCGAF